MTDNVKKHTKVIIVNIIHQKAIRCWKHLCWWITSPTSIREVNVTAVCRRRWSKCGAVERQITLESRQSGRKDLWMIRWIVMWTGRILVEVVNSVVHWRSRLSIRRWWLIELKNVADMKARWRSLRIFIESGENQNENKSTTNRFTQLRWSLHVVEKMSHQKVRIPS